MTYDTDIHNETENDLDFDDLDNNYDLLPILTLKKVQVCLNHPSINAVLSIGSLGKRLKVVCL